MGAREYLDPLPAVTDYYLGRYPSVDLKYRDKILSGEIKIICHKSNGWWFKGKWYVGKSRDRWKLRFIAGRRPQLKDPGLRFYKKFMPLVFKGKYATAIFKMVGYIQKKDNILRDRHISILMQVFKDKDYEHIYERAIRFIVQDYEQPRRYGFINYMDCGYHYLTQDKYPVTGISNWYTKRDKETNMPVWYNHFEILEDGLDNFNIQKEFEAKEDKRKVV